MSQTPSLAVRSLLRAMRKGEGGRINLQLPDGTRQDFGAGQLVCEGRIHSWDVLEQILRRGDVAVAETYIDGSFELDRPDGLIEWACRNEVHMKRAIKGIAVAMVLDRLRHWRNKNTLAQSRKNIASHYDLGNDFYQLWLDQTMTYSSAIYTPETPTLESAQTQKFERILQQCGAKTGDHILEIGCGWGGFFSHAVKSRGCRVTAVTISQRQYDFCLRRIEREGLQNHVTLLLEDYRTLRGEFDHVVSIEMIEAVGSSFWLGYFQKVRSLLKSTGKAVIQSITIREDLARSYANGTDFIQQYIFPGGQLPPPSAFATVSGNAGLKLVSMHAFAPSYERTLHDWRARFNQARGDVLNLGFDSRFLRLWDFYLAYCQGAFRIDRVGVSQFTLEPVAQSRLTG